jgi:hypothetical protein
MGRRGYAARMEEISSGIARTYPRSDCISGIVSSIPRGQPGVAKSGVYKGTGAISDGQELRRTAGGSGRNGVIATVTLEGA